MTGKACRKIRRIIREIAGKIAREWEKRKKKPGRPRKYPLEAVVYAFLVRAIEGLTYRSVVMRRDVRVGTFQNLKVFVDKPDLLPCKGGSGWGWPCGKTCIVQPFLYIIVRKPGIFLIQKTLSANRRGSEKSIRGSVYGTAFPGPHGEKSMDFAGSYGRTIPAPACRISCRGAACRARNGGNRRGTCGEPCIAQPFWYHTARKARILLNLWAWASRTSRGAEGWTAKRAGYSISGISPQEKPAFLCIETDVLRDTFRVGVDPSQTRVFCGISCTSPCRKSAFR